MSLESYAAASCKYCKPYCARSWGGGQIAAHVLGVDVQR